MDEVFVEVRAMFVCIQQIIFYSIKAIKEKTKENHEKYPVKKIKGRYIKYDKL